MKLTLHFVEKNQYEQFAMRPEIYFLIAAVLFFIRSSLATYFECDNPSQEFFNRRVIFCNSSEIISSVTLPEDLSKDVEYLRIEARDAATLFIRKLDVFSNLSSLLGLDISVGRTLRFADPLLDGDMREKLETELFNLPRLKILTIKFFIFNKSKKFKFALPASLEEFALINSSVNLDGLLNTNLRKLNLSRNEMSRMPTNEKLFHLSSLDLSFNPLNKFTVHDIAPFCSLKFLKIQNSSIERCECLKLQKFVKLLLANMKTFKFEGILPCSHDASTSDHNCSLDVEEAMNMRRKCVVTLVRPLAFDLADVCIISLLLLAFCIGCCVFLFNDFMKID